MILFRLSGLAAASSPRQGSARALLTTLVLCLALTPALLAQSAPTRYFVEDSSQVFGVLDSPGNLLEYVYDPVGKALEIKRSTSPATALRPGTTFLICGQNLAVTLGSNQSEIAGRSGNITIIGIDLAAATFGTLPTGGITFSSTSSRDFAAERLVMCGNPGIYRVSTTKVVTQPPTKAQVTW